ncbi:MAG: hypothetical protein WD052_12375 [Bacteroidales bacterium]
MFKRVFLTCIVALVTATIINAQKTDQVVLKNGSIVRGNIVKIVPDGNVTIDDHAGNTWVFPMTDVDNITETDEPANYGALTIPGEWVNMSTIGFLIGSQNSDYIAPFSMQTSFGYMAGNGVYTGVLLGMEFLNINYIPVMADFQYALGQGDVVPFLLARGGYTIPTKFNKEYYNTNIAYTGGFTGAIGMGLKITSRENFAWDVSVLYRYMQINYSETYDWQPYERIMKDIYNRIEFRLGFYLGM